MDYNEQQRRQQVENQLHAEKLQRDATNAHIERVKAGEIAHIARVEAGKIAQYGKK